MSDVIFKATIAMPHPNLAPTVLVSSLAITQLSTQIRTRKWQTRLPIQISQCKLFGAFPSRHSESASSTMDSSLLFQKNHNMAECLSIVNSRNEYLKWNQDLVYTLKNQPHLKRTRLSTKLKHQLQEIPYLTIKSRKRHDVSQSTALSPIELASLTFDGGVEDA